MNHQKDFIPCLYRKKKAARIAALMDVLKKLFICNNIQFKVNFLGNHPVFWIAFSAIS
ncbi:hypothetical protein QF004_002494 [Chryseobacterium sp. MDT2-18]|nr:hypothetical protein [Chryseobacterium sp. MDT2-18]